jgi:hypothetical protein
MKLFPGQPFDIKLDEKARMRGNSMRTLFTSLAFAGLLNAKPIVNNAGPDSLTCPIEEGLGEVYIYEQELQFPVFINTSIATNTVLNINGGIVINIENAPTQLITSTLGTSLQTVTSTVFYAT